MKLRELLSQIKAIQEEINSSTVYICGGAARDRYMQRLYKIEDLDLTTGDKTVDIISLKLFDLLKEKYNVKRKIMSDGHSSIFLGNLKIDFSSNYNAPNIEKILKSLGIDNPSNIRKETYSRDFTCNALLMDFNLTTLIDPTNQGFTDIKQKKIKTCLSPNITFLNKEKRIIRSVYLAAKLGFDIDQSIIDYVNLNIGNINFENINPTFTSDKLNVAFAIDGDRAAYYLNKMNLWSHIPITESMYPYYLKYLKVSNAK